MRVVVASDSFKGTFSAAQACEAIAAGVLAAEPTAEVLIRPMADGGEGTLEALSAAWGVPVVEVAAVDAIGRPARGCYAMHEATAVVELASANGLPGVSDVALRPRSATTRGTGQVLRAALDAGAREVLLCVGGSASTDGGSGILTELGVRLLDASGAPVADGGAGLADLVRIDLGGLHPAARDARWRIAVDVTNPLTGPAGAAAVSSTRRTSPSTWADTSTTPSSGRTCPPRAAGSPRATWPRPSRTPSAPSRPSRRSSPPMLWPSRDRAGPSWPGTPSPASW